MATEFSSCTALIARYGGSVVLLGRARDLNRLRSALDAAEAGHHEAFLVVGEAGVGKSALLRELCADSRARNFVVLTTSGNQYAQDFSVLGSR